MDKVDCLLFDMERKTAEMLRLLNRNDEAETFGKNAEKRKEGIFSTKRADFGRNTTL